jgi:hypothetical protein
VKAGGKGRPLRPQEIGGAEEAAYLAGHFRINLALNHYCGYWQKYRSIKGETREWNSAFISLNLANNQEHSREIKAFGKLRRE